MDIATSLISCHMASEDKIGSAFSTVSWHFNGVLFCHFSAFWSTFAFKSGQDVLQKKKTDTESQVRNDMRRGWIIFLGEIWDCVEKNWTPIHPGWIHLVPIRSSA